MKAGTLVILRGTLAFSLGFLKPIAMSIHQHATHQQPLLALDVWDLAFSGALGGVMMLVTFFDGSFSRWRNGADNPDAQVQAKTDPPKLGQEQPKPQEAKCIT